MNKLENIHPAEVLLEEFLVPMELSQNRIAREIGLPPRRINEIDHGKRSVTADTALRLARYFGTTEAFWMGFQADFDLKEARNRLGKRLETDVSVHAAKVSLTYRNFVDLKDGLFETDKRSSRQSIPYFTPVS